MEHAALGSVCVHEGVHACMDAAWARAWCACGAWPSWRDMQPCALAERRLSSPQAAGMGRSPASLQAGRGAAQIKGSGVCLCHTLISTSLSPDLSIIKCQGWDEDVEII